MGRNSFLMYTSYRDNLSILSDEERGKLVLLLLDYVETGEEPPMDGMVKLAFSFIKSQIDRDNEKYKARCERNRENGKNGGRPSKPNGLSGNPENPVGFSETQGNPEKPRKPDDDNEDDNDDDINTPPKSPKKKPEPKKKYAEFVSMTVKEHDLLIEKFGQAKTAGCIEILDNYKGSSGKKYKSDYRAILNWVAKRYDEEHPHDDGPYGTDPNASITDDEYERMKREHEERLRRT